MTGGYVDLEQARWDLQVATGQTVAGSGVEARMREARAAAGRLAAGLPGLLDELEQLRSAARALEAVRDWAMANEIAEPPLDWAGLRAALSAASPTTSDDQPTKTAAQLIREIAARDPEAHRQALGRGYGVDRDPAYYAPSVGPDDPEGAN